MRNLIKSIGIFLSMLFKKSSEGAATATGLTVTPGSLPESEIVVVKEEEDNFYSETINKSFRQMQYDKVVKDNNIVENPYLEWDKLVDKYHVDWEKVKPTDDDIEPYLKELRMTKEQFITFRKTLQEKKKIS